MAESKAQLRIIQITDVYTLENFPKLKTLIAEKTAEVEATGGKCISILTGDFLAPYLLSSLDKVELEISSSHNDWWLTAGGGDDVDAEQDTNRLSHLGQPRAWHGARGRDEEREGIQGSLDQL